MKKLESLEARLSHYRKMAAELREHASDDRSDATYNELTSLAELYDQLVLEVDQAE